MAVPLIIVDSFTDQPFRGNPAGVCLLDEPAPAEWMQGVAAEVNLSETAFLVRRDDGSHDLRWFTPTVEVDLCGHATLASAHVLGGAGRFHTRSGILVCAPGADGAIEMDLPADPVGRPDPSANEAWAVAIGLPSSCIVSSSTARSKWVLLEVLGEAHVREAAMDRPAVVGLGGSVIVAADTTGDASISFDAVSRVFVPGGGIDEDPVTGSAHCVIGPWLAERHGRTSFVGRQASSRGGTVGMRVEGERVVVSGTAVTVSEGQLLIAPG